MSRQNKAGWFAEIPKDLKAEFSALYPGRSNVRRFTIAFVSWAIREKLPLETLEKKLKGGLNNQD